MCQDKVEAVSAYQMSLSKVSQVGHMTTILKECLTTAITEHEAEDGLVEKGRDAILFQSCYSHCQMTGYYPKYMREMVMLVCYLCYLCCPH
jgi:hypothetical protein